jgi:hypothetical protein
LQVPPCSPTLPHGKDARRLTARLKERVLKLPLHPLFVSLAGSILVAGVCACSTAVAKSAQSTSPAATAITHVAPDIAALQAFAKQIGVSCENEGGRLACIGGRPDVGDYSDIDLHPGCEANGWFGLIHAKRPVELRNLVTPLDTKTVAMLEQGQVTCIRAIGQVKGHAFYYFVTAVPSAAAPACAGNSACVSFPIRWTSRKPSSPCRADTQHSLRNCASGWIQAEELIRLSPAPDPQAHGRGR